MPCPKVAALLHILAKFSRLKLSGETFDWRATRAYLLSLRVP
ncbi:hypothetical protein [Streptomyces minutiscleroticus]|nr:hypothetical protein [Streptomyces minutiscleroticus]